MQEQIVINNKTFELFIPEIRIKARVKEMAATVNEDYKDMSPLFVAILSGSFMFASDLFREIEVHCGITFVKLSSYEGHKTTGDVRQLLGLPDTVSYKDIIIIEDIIDTGNTIRVLMDSIRQYKPNSIKIATLLYKENANITKEKVDYIGFEVPADFVVGYGLDYMEIGRNLRDIYILKK
jgi:hypoxanthine phosphoribosyltransferase